MVGGQGGIEREGKERIEWEMVRTVFRCGGPIETEDFVEVARHLQGGQRSTFARGKLEESLLERKRQTG